METPLVWKLSASLFNYNSGMASRQLQNRKRKLFSDSEYELSRSCRSKGDQKLVENIERVLAAAERNFSVNSLTEPEIVIELELSFGYHSDPKSHDVLCWQVSVLLEDDIRFIPETSGVAGRTWRLNESATKRVKSASDIVVTDLECEFALKSIRKQTVSISTIFDDLNLLPVANEEVSRDLNAVLPTILEEVGTENDDVFGEVEQTATVNRNLFETPRDKRFASENCAFLLNDHEDECTCTVCCMRLSRFLTQHASLVEDAQMIESRFLDDPMLSNLNNTPFDSSYKNNMSATPFNSPDLLQRPVFSFEWGFEDLNEDANGSDVFQESDLFQAISECMDEFVMQNDSMIGIALTSEEL